MEIQDINSGKDSGLKESSEKFQEKFSKEKDILVAQHFLTKLKIMVKLQDVQVSVIAASLSKGNGNWK